MSATIVNVAAGVSLVILGGLIPRRAGKEELAQRLLLYCRRTPAFFGIGSRE